MEMMSTLFLPTLRSCRCCRCGSFVVLLFSSNPRALNTSRLWCTRGACPNVRLSVGTNSWARWRPTTVGQSWVFELHDLRSHGALGSSPMVCRSDRNRWNRRHADWGRAMADRRPGEVPVLFNCCPCRILPESKTPWHNQYYVSAFPIRAGRLDRTTGA